MIEKYNPDRKNKMETFMITRTHLDLVDRVSWRWDDSEYGAPAIDPKKPYGNSSVASDIREITGIDSLTRDDCRQLHEDTLVVMQIMTDVTQDRHLSTGLYVGQRDKYGFLRGWRRATDQDIRQLDVDVSGE